MKNLSIKLQLTIWYTLTIFLVTVTLFAAFYYITQRAIILETDRSLRTHAAQVADNIALNTDNIFDSQTREILDVSKSEIPGIFITSTDAAGHQLGNTDDGAFFKLAKEAIDTRKESYSHQTLNGTALRLISYPILRDGRVIGTIIMGHPTDYSQQALRQLRGVALLLMAFLILPSILLGYVLASNASAPIDKLAKGMQKITSENLSRRVAVPPKSLETFTLITNFNNLLDRLNEAFTREKQFIGEAAHEIKTPLAVIKSNAEVTLSKERQPYDYRTSLAQILNQTEKLSKRLSGLIDFAWSQTVDVQKHFSKVNISGVLAEVCESARFFAETKKVSLHRDIAEHIYVSGKEDKLSQVFYNIIDNAIKYNKEGGEVRVGLRKEQLKAIVTISDTGIGIDKEDIRTIFDRFYRAENNKNIKGHGLGLAIANSIIKAHNGSIEVTSMENTGTTFTITLPLSS